MFIKKYDSMLFNRQNIILERKNNSKQLYEYSIAEIIYELCQNDKARMIY